MDANTTNRIHMEFVEHRIVHMVAKFQNARVI